MPESLIRLRKSCAAYHTRWNVFMQEKKCPGRRAVLVSMHAVSGQGCPSYRTSRRRDLLVSMPSWCLDALGK